MNDLGRAFLAVTAGALIFPLDFTGVLRIIIRDIGGVLQFIDATFEKIIAVLVLFGNRDIWQVFVAILFQKFAPHVNDTLHFVGTFARRLLATVRIAPVAVADSNGLILRTFV